MGRYWISAAVARGLSAHDGKKVGIECIGLETSGETYNIILEKHLGTIWLFLSL